MKELRIFLLLIVLNLSAIGMLNSIFTSDSPEYDAWKREQIKPLNPADKAEFIAPTFDTYHGTERDPYNLLIPLDEDFILAMAPNDDGYTSQIPLPFVFSLYGELYDYVYVNNNGNVTFDYGLYSYTPWGFPIEDSPMLAPFFADVDTRGAGAVWYKIESNRVIVIWDHVGYYGSNYDKLNTFELIFTDGTDPTIGLGNTVAFSYADMAWTTGDASSGSEGFGGAPATVGNNKGDGILYDQIGRFDHPGIDYDGPVGNDDGVDWLDGKIFYFDTGSVATMSIVPTSYEIALYGVEPPAGVDPEDPNTTVYTASYPDAGFQTVQIPVDEGLWRGWIYYSSTWHMADVFPVTGPGTVRFSNIPFGAKFNVPFLLSLTNPTLPVELSSFTAVQTDQNFAKLTWVSQSETALMGYRVYRNETDNQQNALMITPVMIGATNTSTTQTYNYNDREVEIGHSYWYWLESVDYGSSQFYGPVSIQVVADTAPVLPVQTLLRNAYPNPFKAIGSTTIEVDVKENDHGHVAIYNLVGQEVISWPVASGNNQINWNGKDKSGKACATGVYFYKLTTTSLNQTRKLMLVK